MKQFTLCLISMLFFAALCHAQPGAPQPVPDSTLDIWAELKNPDNVIPAMFIMARIAEAKQDFVFTGPVTHREYRLTPAQQISITAGTVFTGIALKKMLPKMRKPINIAMTLAAFWSAGRAYGAGIKQGHPLPPLTP